MSAGPTWRGLRQQTGAAASSRACRRERPAQESVVNLTALVTLDKTDLDPAIGHLPASVMHDGDRGLRRILGW